MLQWPTYQYQISGDTYLKRWDCVKNRFVVTRDGQCVSAAEWNRVTSQAWKIPNRLDHPSALIRWIEAHRCRLTQRMARTGSPARRFLDIGCETGHVTASLMRGCRLGLLADREPTQLALARTRVPPNVSLMAADLFHLPLRPRSFDLVVCTEVLEHLEEPAAAVRELARVLAPGGRLVVSVPNDRLIVRSKRWVRWLGLGSMLGPLNPDLSPDHLQLFSRESLWDLLKSCLRPGRVFYSLPFGLHIFGEAVRPS